MPVLVNTRQELYDELSTAESSLAIVEYFAKWCKQCTESEKWIDQIEHEHPNTLVIRVDTDILAGYAKKMKVKAVPTFHFYSKNKKNARKSSRKPSAAPKSKSNEEQEKKEEVVVTVTADPETTVQEPEKSENR
ncbi:Oidioi.mRNA.OKI2018_I69.PAR.g9998.t1.cds [Oikopleura dioica]|uniref:Oidioi.mRNA.OKI2018_I69.PAR.g9998.t1.cds n=1 Tax=Oikopleura dioica TaxID=34765 RepID=A0ABN7RSG5_OIKDI|nr:Oidioi.mRNA.OKI2018_I69.PAR.g9998.t1.cds [Oikopleura dioica]